MKNESKLIMLTKIKGSVILCIPGGSMIF